MSLDEADAQVLKTCTPVPCPPFERLDPEPIENATGDPDQHALGQTISLNWRDLPEGAKARLAEMTRHPQCLITSTHPAHDLIKATTSGFRCGGHPKPPRA